MQSKKLFNFAVTKLKKCSPFAPLPSLRLFFVLDPRLYLVKAFTVGQRSRNQTFYGYLKKESKKKLEKINMLFLPFSNTMKFYLSIFLFLFGTLFGQENEDIIRDSTHDNTHDNTQDNTQDNTHDNTYDNTQDNPSLLESYHHDLDSWHEHLSHEGQSFESKFFHMLLILGLLIAFMIIASWALKRMMKSRVTQINTSSSIKVLETRYLSPRATLYLIEVEEETFLIAESPHAITLLESKGIKHL